MLTPGRLHFAICSERSGLDCIGALLRSARPDPGDLESEIAVGFFVNPLKTQCIVKVDSPRLRVRDEAKILHKENLLFVDGLFADPVQLAPQRRSDRQFQISRQGRRTNRRTVVELDRSLLPSRSNLSLLLKIRQLVYKRRRCPGLGNTLRLPKRDKIGGRLFNHAEAIEFQLTQKDRLSGTRCAGQDVPPHLSAAARALATNARTFPGPFGPVPIRHR